MKENINKTAQWDMWAWLKDFLTKEYQEKKQLKQNHDNSQKGLIQ